MYKQASRMAKKTAESICKNILRKLAPNTKMPVCLGKFIQKLIEEQENMIEASADAPLELIDINKDGKLS